MTIISFALSCLTIAAFGIAIMIPFLLYCCIRVSTPYDRQIDDEQQQDFVNNYPDL